jgi:FkbM family methyltransferase
MIRDNIKEICINFGLNLTPNIKYKREAKVIINELIMAQDKCIDIGCFKGEILSFITNKAPDIYHYAFESLQEYCECCQNKFPNVKVFNIALSNKKSKGTFVHIMNNPAFSGLKPRTYDGFTPKINMLDIQIDTLDNIIPSDEKIKLIKISANGGEHDILKGATKLLKREKPFIIFEYGIGASEFYDSNPTELYEYLKSFDYKLSKLSDWIKKNDNPLSLSAFLTNYNNNAEFLFFAYQ